MRRLIIIFLVIAIGLLVISPINAEDEPVVFALFFYSPTCPHCHNVINWFEESGILEEFGDQLLLFAFDVTSPEGETVFRMAHQSMNIEGNGVPMMIIGETILYGEKAIPDKMQGVVSEGLKNGGIGLPPIPGLQEAYDQLVAQEETPPADTAESTAEATAETAIEATDEATAETATEAPPEATAAVTAGDTTTPTTGLSEVDSAALETIGQEPTLIEKFAADPIANTLAVIALLALLVSGLFILLAAYRSATGSDSSTAAAFTEKTNWWIVMVVALASLASAITLVLHGATDSLATPMAWAVTLLLFVAALVIFQSGQTSRLPGWLLLVVVLAGLGVAAYLSYVEITQTEAVCGMVGNCNAVQASPYARLFGILPIGVFGILGYIAILGAWLIGQTNNPQMRRISHILLLVLSLFGVAFSTYLTFLEPFVIGATCAWCLTSAVLMLLLLWIVAKEGLHDLAEAMNAASQQPA